VKPATTVPLRPLLALAAAVLAAHLLVLRAAPGPLQVSASSVQPFITRTVALAPRPTAAAQVQPAAMQPAVLRVPPRAEPHRARAALAVLTAADPAVAADPPGTLALAAPSPAASQPAPTPTPGVQADAFRVPGSMRLHYEVTAQLRGQTWPARGELVWRREGDSYEAELEIRAPLLPRRMQRSTGRITAEGLAPLRYSEKARSEEAAHFERDNGKVSFSSNRPDAPLLPGAQDRLSVLLQLGAMIAGAPQKFPPATTITVQTAGTREAEPWLFTVEREEELQLPGGALKTLKLTRNPRKEFDQKLEFWLAPAMDYAPVRLRLTQPNGDSVDQQWASTDRG